MAETRPSEVWHVPEEAPPVSWSCIEASLRIPQHWADPHKLVQWAAQSPRRAAVAVVLWGDVIGARHLVLVQRGYEAPRHAGELAFPGGMVEPWDRDLPATARRELEEELGIHTHLWELGCFPDGIAKARTRFTPVFFRWEDPKPRFQLSREIHDVLLVPLMALLQAPWRMECLDREGHSFWAPRLELTQAPLWGATAMVLKAWLDGLAPLVPA